MARICLNMIVKNETAVIRRCLASIKPLLHYWVIVDTGSTDGTQDVIRDFMQGVPGELHERPWRNFGLNRTEALQLAYGKGDFLLFIDADEVLATPPGFAWPASLRGTAYYFECLYADLRYQRNALVSTALPWRWDGVVHEYLSSTQPHTWEVLPGPKIHASHDGARAQDPNTYLRDIEVLQAAIESEPSNKRYAFYLAQSFKDSGQLALAREQYLRRASMGGWEEERWTAQFRAAQLGENLGLPPERIRNEYLDAWQNRPTRAEPLYELARYHRLRSEFRLAWLFARHALLTPCPTDILFIDASVYEWRCLDELTVAASFCPDLLDEGRVAMVKLLANSNLPPLEHARIEGNKRFFGL